MKCEFTNGKLTLQKVARNCRLSHGLRSVIAVWSDRLHVFPSITMHAWCTELVKLEQYLPTKYAMTPGSVFDDNCLIVQTWKFSYPFSHLSVDRRTVCLLSFQCVGGMLTTMPNPNQLILDLQSMDNALETRLPASMTDMQSALSSMEENTMDAMETPNPGPLQTISDSRSTIADLTSKLTAYRNAMAALPA